MPLYKNQDRLLFKPLTSLQKSARKVLENPVLVRRRDGKRIALAQINAERLTALIRLVEHRQEKRKGSHSNTVGLIVVMVFLMLMTLFVFQFMMAPKTTTSASEDVPAASSTCPNGSSKTEGGQCLHWNRGGDM